MNNYKIDLGISLNQGDLAKVKTTINNLENSKKINLEINRKKIDSQLNSIRKQIQNLSNIKINLGGNGDNTLSLNTKSLNESLSEVANYIKTIKHSIGTLDDGGDMKSLLSSINQITASLEKASNQFTELNRSIDALSKKDFGFNLNLDIGKTKTNPIKAMTDYGKEARRNTIPQLQEQAAYLQNLLGGYQKADVALERYLVKIHKANGIRIKNNLIDDIADTSSISKQMEALEKYIGYFKKIATSQGIKLDGFDAQFSKSAETMVDDTVKIQTGAKQAEESIESMGRELQKIFSSGIDGGKLSGQLNDIITDLRDIKEVLQGLSKGISVDGLTQSFDRLSETLEKLVSNAKLVQSVLGDSLGGSASIDTGAINKVEKISDNSTAAIIQNEKKKQEAYKATAETVMYHAGIVSKLNKAETNGRFYGSNRGTGYFGTGHYFVDSATKHELDNDSHYNKLPYTSIDISKYDNLFKATTDEVAGKLHTFLSNLTAFTQGSDSYDVSELFTQFKSVFGDTIMDVKEFGSKLDQLKAFMSNSSLDDRSDSVSTQFMKSLGYEGVDTRGTRYADTRYGTVIYDLKEESILQANITDELQKQGQMLEKINYTKGQAFDKDTDNRLQGILDQQNKSREIDEEFNKIYDSTALNSYETELNAVNNKLKENDNIIANCQEAIANADKYAREFARDMEDVGLKVSESEIEDDANRRRQDYQGRIDELKSEQVQLESRKKSLEESISSEYRLANESREQAKQIVEQRHLEAQQAQETANTVVQSEERKQRAYQETADAVERVSKIKIGDTELDGLNLKDDIDETDKLAAAFSRLNNIQKNIGNIKIGELDTSKGIQSLQTLENQLESLSAEYNETVAEINGYGGVSATQFQKVQNQIDTTKLKLEQLESEIADTKAKLANNIRLDFSKNDLEIKSLENSFEKLSNKPKELRVGIEQVKQALTSMKKASTDDELIKSAKEYKQALKEVNAQLKQNRIDEEKTHRSDSFKLDKERAMHRLKSLFTDNSEAARMFGADLERLQRELNECGDTKGLQRINKEITNLNSRIKESGAKTQTLGDKLRKQFSQYSSYLSIASLYMYAEQALRSMFEQVKLIDSAMTELKKVTDETEESYNRFLTNAATKSREIGTTIDGLVSSTADFARLGYGFEESQGLAEVANIYAVVGDEINGVEGATESLISTMAAFKAEANGLSEKDFAMSIIDKLNEVSNNYAISSGGLGEALKRSSSAMFSANNTLDETIALITASNTVVQDADVVGNAYKTIALRIRGAKSELEEMGEDTSGMAESSAKLREELLALSGVDILEADGKTFKSTYDILNEISKVYKNLSDLSQANILEKLAGKRQSNILSAALENFDIARNALDTSMNSAGSASAELEKWQKSLEANGLPRHLEINVIERI